MNAGAEHQADAYPMDKLIAKLSEQQAVFNQQNEALKSGEDDGALLRIGDRASSSNSLPITPATEAFSTTAPTTRPASATVEDSQAGHEVLLLKRQLAQANAQISQLDNQLAHSRTIKPEIDAAESAGLAYPRGLGQVLRDNVWNTQDDARSDTSEVISNSAFGRTRGLWGNSNLKSAFSTQHHAGAVGEPPSSQWGGNRNLTHGGFMESDGSGFSAPEPYRGDRLTPDTDLISRGNVGRRGGRFDSRVNSPRPFNGPYGGHSAPTSHYDPTMGQMPGGPMNGPQSGGPLNMSVSMYPQYQPPIGTALSPYASEFTSKSAWNTEVGSCQHSSS